MTRTLAIIAAIIVLGGPLPGSAMPIATTIVGVARERPAPEMLPVKHHWHYRHWRYRQQGWSSYTPYYAVPPETAANEAPSPGYGSRYAGAAPPPAPAQPAPDPVGGKTSASRPRIDWVNPDRAAR